MFWHVQISSVANPFPDASFLGAQASQGVPSSIPSCVHAPNAAVSHDSVGESLWKCPLIFTPHGYMTALQCHGPSGHSLSPDSAVASVTCSAMLKLAPAAMVTRSPPPRPNSPPFSQVMPTEWEVSTPTAEVEMLVYGVCAKGERRLGLTFSAVDAAADLPGTAVHFFGVVEDGAVVGFGWDGCDLGTGSGESAGEGGEGDELGVDHFGQWCRYMYKVILEKGWDLRYCLDGCWAGEWLWLLWRIQRDWHRHLYTRLRCEAHVTDDRHITAPVLIRDPDAIARRWGVVGTSKHWGKGVADFPSSGNCEPTLRAWLRHNVFNCEALPSFRDDRSHLWYKSYITRWSVEAEADRMGAVPQDPSSDRQSSEYSTLEYDPIFISNSTSCF